MGGLRSRGESALFPRLWDGDVGQLFFDVASHALSSELLEGDIRLVLFLQTGFHRREGGVKEPIIGFLSFWATFCAVSHDVLYFVELIHRIICVLALDRKVELFVAVTHFHHHHVVPSVVLGKSEDSLRCITAQPKMIGFFFFAGCKKPQAPKADEGQPLISHEIPFF